MVQAMGGGWDWPYQGGGDLKCPPPLEPHLQELLSGEEPSPVGAEVEDRLLPLPMSMPKDAEPSALCHTEWVEWHTRHELPLPLWKELIKIPGHPDYKELAWKVWTSFEVPKACNQVEGIDNAHTHLLVHHSIGKSSS